MTGVGSASRRRTLAVLTFCVTAAAGCGERFDLGSDVLWTARFEGGSLGEWTGVTGGDAQAFPSPPNTIAVSSDRARHGSYAAALTITAGPDDTQENAGLSRSGELPTEAYYSAWYYLPRSVTVGPFWVIFKFRTRTDVNDPTTEGEFYDLDLVNLPTGEMTLRLYDHLSGQNVPLDLPNQIVPAGVWFQIEAFYRNAPDTTGRVTYWFNGQQIVDVTGQPTGPTPWVGWDVCSVGEDLMPETEVLYVDDCAISLSRVGPNGIIAE